jgi:hypothetical protein
MRGHWWLKAGGVFDAQELVLLHIADLNNVHESLGDEEKFVMKKGRSYAS